MSSQTPTTSHSGPVTLEEFGYTQELKRGLRPWQMAIFGLVFMIPIAPFGIYGQLAQASNNMVPLVYFIGMVAMIFTALSYGRMARAFPISGSVYAYASRGINKHVGFMTGWAILLDYILMPTLIYVVCGVSMNLIIPQIPALGWALIFLVIVTAFNTFGIEASSALSIIALVFELVVYVVFVIFALIAISHGTEGAVFTPDPIFNAHNFHIAMVMNGVSIAVLSFLGFDAISTLAEETKGGNKSVGRATIGALLILGVLFIFLTWVAGCLWPGMFSDQNIDIAFNLIAQRAGGTWLMNLCAVGTALSWGFAGLTAQVAVSRVLFSMSRDGNFPKFFSKVHKRFKTPYVATWFIAGLSVIMCIVFQNLINTLTTLVNFGALTSFFVLNFTVFWHYFVKRDKSLDPTEDRTKLVLKYVVLPVIGMLIILAVWISLGWDAKILGVCWLVIGLAYYLILTKVMHKSAKMDI